MTPRRLSPLSLRARLTLWYSFALLAVLGTFAVVIVWQEGRIGLRRVDRELAALSATLENVLRDELTEMPSAVQAAVEVQRTMATPGHPIAILDDSGSVMSATWHGLTLDLPVVVRTEPRVST
jgi:hypothetical protein